MYPDTGLGSSFDGLDEFVVSRFEVQRERGIADPSVHMNTNVHFQNIPLLQD